MLYAYHVCLLATQKLKVNMRQKKKKELKWRAKKWLKMDKFER